MNLRYSDFNSLEMATTPMQVSLIFCLINTAFNAPTVINMHVTLFKVGDEGSFKVSYLQQSFFLIKIALKIFQKNCTIDFVLVILQHG